MPTDSPERQKFLDNINRLEKMLTQAKSQLNAYDSLPENNVFATIEDALYELEDDMREEAAEDCEGAYNIGNDTYTRKFMLQGKPEVYEATLHVEYNRHDKTYYYIEESRIEYKQIT